MIDIVFPNNNEKDFIKIAEKIGYKEICFVYSIQKIKSKKQTSKKLKIKYGILTEEKNINKAKKLSNIVLVDCSDNTRNII